MATNPDTIDKQPSEKYTINFNFKKQLAKSGTTIQSVTVVAIDNNGNDVSSVILAGKQIDSNGETVDVGIKGGTDSNDYKVTVIAETDGVLPDGTTKETFEAETTICVNDL